VPFLGELDGYRIILLEFHTPKLLPVRISSSSGCCSTNIRPLIAHPERNQDVMRDLSKIEPFVEIGMLPADDSGCPAGGLRAGRHNRRALQLLEFDVFKVLASDAHNLTGRRPALREGMEAAARVIGEQAAHDLVYRNPRMILRGAMAAVA